MRAILRPMSLACRRLLLPAVVAALAVACSGSGAAPALPRGDAPAATLSFDVDGGVLTAAPREELKVGIRSHGTIGPVTLSLDGDCADASLDRATTKVDGSGDGEFFLRAPSIPATFSVVAVASAIRARLDVAVSRHGFATIPVLPDYKGKRPVPIVAASVFLQTTCATSTSRMTVNDFGLRNPPSGPRARTAHGRVSKKGEHV